MQTGSESCVSDRFVLKAADYKCVLLHLFAALLLLLLVPVLAL